jgi:hypothetical protein
MQNQTESKWNNFQQNPYPSLTQLEQDKEDIQIFIQLNENIKNFVDKIPSKYFERVPEIIHDDKHPINIEIVTIQKGFLNVLKFAQEMKTLMMPIELLYKNESNITKVRSLNGIDRIMFITSEMGKQINSEQNVMQEVD